MGELLPYANQKQTLAELNGLPYHEYSQPLTAEETERLQERVDFQLYFSNHGNNPHDFHAVDGVIRQADPRKTLIATERLAYDPQANHPANQVREDTKSPANSFDYARQYSNHHGIPFVYTDFDRLDNKLWQRAQEKGNALELPARNTVAGELIADQWISMDFTTAVQEFTERTANSNWDRQKATEYRWGEKSSRREQVAAQTLTRTALEQLNSTDLQDDEKLQVMLFFGSNHQPGIEEQLKNLGLRFTSHTVDTHTSTFTKQPLPVSRDTYNALSFATQFFWNHTNHGEGLGISSSQFSIGIREIPVEWLATIYEAYRHAVQETRQLPEDMRGSYINSLPLQLSEELYNAANAARQATAYQGGA